MKRIDRETVGKILDAADIVDVVSDFVSLKRRGANYIGLCPFHNERTPSFSVSKARGICKCFSCGKGGSAVGFIMEHEGYSYNEALRYLAKKYHIEIKEEEMSPEEQQADLERESMLAINEWAMERFRYFLTQTESGRDIGLSYFRERGINDTMIERYRLGYDLLNDELSKEALVAGYNEKYLIETGLSYRKESTGKLCDRFKGRVIFPVLSVSGKVVAFGGRTLKSDKNVAKYVNSPESIIYSKSSEVYGLYQAKQAIVKKGFCILTEGYMDVISMSQAGIENVVASSGTSLTKGQIRLIHRFTDKVTVMYDSDAAGIKASMRGIDLLLAEGLDIYIILLPEGDDPDSFAQSHSSTEVEEYIATKSEDFISFKTKILIGDAGDDPIKRTMAIKDVVGSIAVIPDELKRTVYIQECSRMLNMSEETLKRQVSIVRRKNYEAVQKEKEKEAARESIADIVETQPNATVSKPHQRRNEPRHFTLGDYEKEVLRYIVRYGCLHACYNIDKNTGDSTSMNILHFIANDLTNDGITFSDPDNAALFSEALMISGCFEEDLRAVALEAEEIKKEYFEKGVEEIRATAKNFDEIRKREEFLREKALAEFDRYLHDFAVSYLERHLISSSNDRVRRLATDLAIEKHKLSKYHSRFSKVTTEEDRIIQLVVQAMNVWKLAILHQREADILQRMQAALAASNSEEVEKLMIEKHKLYQEKKEFGHLLGDRVTCSSNK